MCVGVYGCVCACVCLFGAFPIKRLWWYELTTLEIDEGNNRIYAITTSISAVEWRLFSAMQPSNLIGRTAITLTCLLQAFLSYLRIENFHQLFIHYISRFQIENYFFDFLNEGLARQTQFWSNHENWPQVSLPPWRTATVQLFSFKAPSYMSEALFVETNLKPSVQIEVTCTK